MPPAQANNASFAGIGTISGCTFAGATTHPDQTALTIRS